MAAFGEIPQVLEADACERGNFRICEDFLTRFYGNHGRGLPISRRSAVRYYL